jgi:hypothetical protein
MSSNDEFVAIGSDTETLIYRVDSRQQFRYQLTSVPSNRLPSQRICFSAESRKFLVATRDGEGNVQVYVNDCMGVTTPPDVASLKMPTVGSFFPPSYSPLFSQRCRPILETLTPSASSSATISDCHRPSMTMLLIAYISPPSQGGHVRLYYHSRTVLPKFLTTRTTIIWALKSSAPRFPPLGSSSSW